jgi:transcription elongation factor Elf1
MLIRYKCSFCGNESLSVSYDRLRQTTTHQHYNVECNFCSFEETVEIRTTQAMSIEFKQSKN